MDFIGKAAGTVGNIVGGAVETTGNVVGGAAETVGNVGGAVVGGAVQTAIDVLGRFAVEDIKLKKNIAMEFVRVVKATEEAVTGTLHSMIIEVIENGKKKLCFAKILVKPWLNHKEVLEFKDADEDILSTFGDVVGGTVQTAIDVLARFAIADYNLKKNIVMEFVRVVKASEQVVTGTIHSLVIEVIENGKKKLCFAKILVKPWLNHKEVLEFKEVEDAV